MRDCASYKRVYETLKREILGGKYSVSNSFPSSTALARRFGITRFTVRQALNILTKEGLIRSQCGRGTFLTKTGSNRQIGLIVPGIVYSEFYPPLVSDLSHICQSNGYVMMFGDVSSSDAAVRAEQAQGIAANFIKQGVSGVIFQPIELLDRSEDLNRRILDAFDKAGIPVVLLAYDAMLSPRFRRHDVVGMNNFDAGWILGEHLASVGAKNVQFVLRPCWSPSGFARLHGVAAALQCAGRGGWSWRNVLRANPDDVAAVRAHLRVHAKADAFICGCDEDAMLLQKTLRRLNREVPKDVLLAGFDDVRYATVMSPKLTTIRQPHNEIAAMAFRALLERMDDQSLPVREIYLPATLVERESTVRPRMVHDRNRRKSLGKESRK